MCSQVFARLEAGILCGSGSARDGQLVTGLPERLFSFSMASFRHFRRPTLVGSMPRMAGCSHSAVASLGMGDGWHETRSVRHHRSRTMPCGNGDHYVCASQLVPNGMRERSMGKGASRRAGVGRVRRETFSASWFYTSSRPARRTFFQEVLLRKVPNSLTVPGNVVVVSRSRG